MTANTDEATVKQIMTLGVSDYVIKPVRPGFVVRARRAAHGFPGGGDPQEEAAPSIAAPMRIDAKTR